MKALLWGATFGWFISSIRLAMGGMFNAGTAAVGVVIVIGWIAYLLNR